MPEGVGAALARRLLAAPAFVRHVVLDRWFLHRHQPALEMIVDIGDNETISGGMHMKRQMGWRLGTRWNVAGRRLGVRTPFLRRGVRHQQAGDACGDRDEDRVGEPARLRVPRREGCEREGDAVVAVQPRPGRRARAGVTRANFGQGQTVTVLAYHAKDGSNFGFMRRMTFADGHSIELWLGDDAAKQ